MATLIVQPRPQVLPETIKARVTDLLGRYPIKFRIEI